MASAKPEQFFTPEQRADRAETMYDVYMGPPPVNLAEVGRRFGISKERVRQIFVEHGHAVRYPRPKNRPSPKEVQKQ